ncbi:transporter substrate-binding domain-containing protein [Halospina sp. K52047b]|uniref:transporter substrate-binding domain-containing protein n=1 Tax=Halospina sp. K52047b TaxID=2614160 RepID=UPI001249CDC3|nr:transporter substrate-binding domain-containing protein [Halospina sp. K52047b]KAA8976955.1 transporter substrate-binding domain-containing protein [Halospina sp. K52047b]
MLRALLYGALLLLASLGSVALQAKPASSEPVTFSLAAIEPWAERTPEGERRGLLVDLVEAIRSRTDIPIRYQVRPHSRAILEMEEGHADFVPTFGAPGINQIAEPVADLVDVQVLVLGRASDEPIDSLNELEGENLGYLSGTWYGHAFAANDTIRKVPVNNVAHGLRLLNRERLRAVVASEVAIPAGIGPDGSSAAIRTLMRLDTLKGKVFMSRSSPREEAAEAIAAAIEGMHEDGTMERLFSNRYEADIARE